jgi:hypothetical protein
MKRTLSSLFAVFLAVSLARADVISFDLLHLDVNTAGGGDAIFQGTVTNNSGTDLNASDFFFNFIGFDFSFVNPVQDLGLTDFTIPDNTTSGVVNLFEIFVGAASPRSGFPVDVQLEDAASDLSSIQKVTVSIPSSAAVPEPRSLPTMLVLIAIVAGVARSSRYRVRLMGLIMTAMVCAMSPAQGQVIEPLFSTQTPTSGVVGQTFEVLLPVVNSGTTAGTQVTVTSVALGSLSPTSPALPKLFDAVNAGDHFVIDLQFDRGKLMLGTTYLLSLRGSYQSLGKTLGFAVNRFVQVSNPSADVFAVLRKWIVLDAIGDFSDSLPGVDILSDGESMLRFVQSRPEFIESGMEQDGSSVWARFANGEVVVICDDRPLTSGTSSTLASGSPSSVHAERDVNPSSANSQAPLPVGLPPSDVPQSSSARLINAMGQGWGGGDVVLDLGSWLVQQNYNLAFGGASVTDLRKIGGEGVLYINSHGSLFGKNTPDSPQHYVLWTSTPADSANDVPLSVDLISGRAEYMRATDSFDPVTGKKKKAWHYCITAEFIRHWWQNLSAGSLVFIDACRSDLDPDFKKAIFEKAASLYVGWTFRVPDDFSADSARLVFDRLLGANNFDPEPEFLQRPFDYTQIETDLPLHHLGEKSVLEFLSFTEDQSATLQFGELAPSIMNMQVDELSKTLTILGSFGQDPGPDGHITIGDTRVTLVDLWNADHLIVDITDPSLAGDVIVEVRGHKSNVATLTEWEGDFTFDANAASGDLAQKFKMHVAFRADIRQFRPLIHQPPFEPGGPLEGIARASSSTFSCSGSHMFTLSPDAMTTAKWSGQGTVNAFQFPTVTRPTPPFFEMVGGLQSHTQMGLSFGLSQDHQNSLCKEDDHTVVTDRSGQHSSDSQSPLDICFNGGDLTVTLDESAVIQAGSLPLAAGCVQFGSTNALRWSAISSVGGTAPDPLSAR